MSQRKLSFKDKEEIELRLEQYKLLREEVMSLISEFRKLEIIVIGGLAALYAWLVVNHQQYSFIWYLGTLIAVLAGIRVFALFRRLERMAKYMRHIELLWPELENEVEGGWELYLKRTIEDQKSFFLRYSVVAFWLILIAATLAIPCILTKSLTEPKPIPETVWTGIITDHKSVTNHVLMTNRVGNTIPGRAK